MQSSRKQSCWIYQRSSCYKNDQGCRKQRLIKGDTLIEATSGNTGIALAMAASIVDQIKLIMPKPHLLKE